MKYQVIGVMSGTSLDGMDLAYCEFESGPGNWSYWIIQAETIPYDDQWKRRLSEVESGSALELARCDADFGHLVGKNCRSFMDRYGISPDFISSHGHTIFHQPHHRFTTQIGKGSAITAETGIPAISDFRSTDVALGGQGAPLVPIGDRLLFGDFDFCLNLGGFSNISFESGNCRIAFDICPVNIVLNNLAGYLGHEFDQEGNLAASGKIIPDLLFRLNSLPYFRLSPPKSLGKEWVLSTVLPLLDPYIQGVDYQKSIPALLSTVCEHVAIQVGKVVNDPLFQSDNTVSSLVKGIASQKKMLCTGGGALNKYLVGCIRQHAACELVIPDLNTINYKEALVFAFLGVLRWRHEINCLSSVTGASRDSSGGDISFMHPPDHGSN